MIKTWRVRLEVARDDGESLEDEAFDALASALAAMSIAPTVSRAGPAAVAVELSVQARTDRDAMSVAERELRSAAATVWSSRGLPPFTISAVTALERSPSSDIA